MSVFYGDMTPEGHIYAIARDLDLPEGVWYEVTAKVHRNGDAYDVDDLKVVADVTPKLGVQLWLTSYSRVIHT